MPTPAQIQFMHLCEHATVDVAQRLSIIDIFQSFNFRELPIAYPKFVIVASVRLEKDDRDHEVRFNLVCPDGTTMGDVAYKVKADRSGNRVFLANFFNREFRMPDQHKVEVLFDGKKISEMGFMVNLQ